MSIIFFDLALIFVKKGFGAQNVVELRQKTTVSLVIHEQTHLGKSIFVFG